MFIEPMTKIGSISELQNQKNANQIATQGIGFQDVFQNAIQNVAETEKDYLQGEYQLATGQIDDAHTVPIAAAKAQLSVEMLVQMRNKALESYNELMRLNL